MTDTASISQGFETPLAWAVGHGYIGGMTETTLAPAGSTTRAQTAAILVRFLTSENVL